MAIGNLTTEDDLSRWLDEQIQKPNVLPIQGVNGLPDWLASAKLDYLCYQDQKPVNTAGGGFTSGAYRTRDLNTEVADTGNFGSVASNQITLAAGTYRCNASAPGNQVLQHKARLRNITDSTTLLVGTSEYANAAQTSSVIQGRFTLAAQKVLEIQHICNTTKAADGLGTQSNATEVEVYTTVEFLREGA